MDYINSNHFFNLIYEKKIFYSYTTLPNQFSTISQTYISWSNFLSFKNMKYSKLLPEIKKDNIFISNHAGIIKAINISSGKEIWIKNLSINNANPRLSGGIGISCSEIDHIYIGSEYGTVYALDIKNGELIWQQKLLGKIFSIPKSTQYGLLIIYTNNGFVQALNEIDGSIQWTIQVYDNIFNMLSYNIFDVKIFSDKIILINNKKEVMAISIYDGEILWKTAIETNSENKNATNYTNKKINFIVIDDKAYISFENGYLICINLVSGKIVWINKSIYALKILNDKKNLYAIDQNKQIIAINLYTGKNIWIYSDKLIKINYENVDLNKKYFIYLDNRKYLYWIDIQNQKHIKTEKINIKGSVYFFKILKNRLIIISNYGNIYSFNII
ncbi:MAG: PQQ-binding-like beta-propeller repeat protein [Wigglesworthia glossinidia]|nr:PQQ-binding-like beta-propeller repeat protein [Wigglesworthia glossinidia]